MLTPACSLGPTFATTPRPDESVTPHTPQTFYRRLTVVAHPSHWRGAGAALAWRAWKWTGSALELMPCPLRATTFVPPATAMAADCEARFCRSKPRAFA